MWKDLYVAGDIGSEGGVVFADEEYKNSCRITLEKCGNYYAITCGVYGSMVHTAFSDFEHYQKLYDTMKIELQNFIDRDTTEDEELDFYDYFCNKF